MGAIAPIVVRHDRCVDDVPAGSQRRPRNAEGTGAMVRFAMYTYGRYSVNYFTRNTDNLLVGWRFGAPALGFYKKAYDLFSLRRANLSPPRQWLRSRVEAAS